MTFGNKIGLLTGDYLLSHSCAELANLRHQEVVELISSAVRDFSESEFIGERDEQNNPLPSHPNAKKNSKADSTLKHIVFDGNDTMVPLSIEDALGIPEKEWECRNILSAGSLLGKSCKAALKLARLGEDLQNQAYLFGAHLSLAWQACLDAEPFQSSTLPLGIYKHFSHNHHYPSFLLLSFKWIESRCPETSFLPVAGQVLRNS